MTDRNKIASVVYVSAQYIRCPHCGEEQRGWHFDPRGASSQCDDCGGLFTVDEDALIRFE